MMYPTPKMRHCLNCRHCVRVIPGNEMAGRVRLVEETPFDRPQSPIRCRLDYWGELPDGREKTYRSAWVASKSHVLASIATRCGDYDDEP